MTWALLGGGVISCSGADQPLAPERLEEVRGLVVKVEARSLLELESLTIEGVEGTRWTFITRGRIPAEFTPSHVRDHMLQGLTVTVTFYRESGTLVLHNLAD